jgi:hypothetical protein
VPAQDLSGLVAVMEVQEQLDAAVEVRVLKTDLAHQIDRVEEGGMDSY